MNKIIKIDPTVMEYIAEGKEIIERVSKSLNLIETNQFNQETLSSLYRDVHTLKGSSQLFGFKKMAQVSHALEASLDPVRKGKIKLDSKVMIACAKNFDLLDRILISIETSGKEIEDDSEMTKLVSLLIEAATGADKTSFELLHDLPGVEEKKQSALTVVSDSEHTQSHESQINSPKATLHLVNSEPLNTSSQIQAQIQVEATSLKDSTIRVQVNLLDRILNLVGELVLVRNQLNQHRHRIEDTDFLNTSKSLDVVTSDLQGEIMKTRMQPIDSVVGKFQRVVRDIARDLGKKIDLTLEGSDTELDKSLLEAIKDPLTHIVRNSCDHGIEAPEDRKKSNKPETGHLLIRSFHEGGQVVVEVSDYGKGIDRKRVIEKAIENGLIDTEKAAKLADREICELIFLPGFSTAKQVTSVSGRGVGMDVVKTNIEKIGGSVEVKSVEKKGTSIQLRIPLTLAIVPALIIKTQKEKFAIPQVKLVELVRVEEGTHHHSGVQIEKLQDRPMFRLRGQLLPLFDLREITGEPYNSDYKSGIFIIVLSTEGENFGLLVPEVMDTADIVVKPISSLLNHLSIFSGATILGDGSIALILDVRGLAEYGKVLNKRTQREDRESFSKQERSKISTDIQEFLLFSIGTNALHSLPLCLVNRLEEFSTESIEQSGEQKIVRYRGTLLPLISLTELLNYNKDPENKKMLKSSNSSPVSVIVVQHSGRNYGLVVDEIVDVMTVDGVIDDSIRDRNGILGNLIHNNEIIVVIDVLNIIEEFNRALGGNLTPLNSNTRNALSELRDLNKEMKFKSVRVLYAEDVAFFRKHVSKVLASAGIDVTTVEDGAKAIQELDSAEVDKYNLILSDIEMPHMNGLELTREIRKRERFKDIPIIALTTRFSSKDIQEGKAIGFNNYLEKLNPEKLLSTIQELMLNEKEKEGAKII
jgi:two-component system chemotaxis sensor kinase CheA